MESQFKEIWYLTSNGNEAVLPVADDAVEHGIELAVVGERPRVRGEGGAGLARRAHAAPARHRRQVHAHAARAVTETIKYFRHLTHNAI